MYAYALATENYDVSGKCVDSHYLRIGAAIRFGACRRLKNHSEPDCLQTAVICIARGIDPSINSGSNTGVRKEYAKLR